MVNKAQRVGVFVDVQNMYYSAKQLFNSKVNFSKILEVAVNKRELVRAICYVIKADIKEESNFHEALQRVGFDVKSKDLQVFHGGAKKGDWDVGIAMDIMRMAAKLDVIVLVSGDGDFKDLLEHVKALGCRAEVIAFKRTSSSRLKDVVDSFFDLETDKKKFLIGLKPPIKSKPAKTYKPRPAKTYKQEPPKLSAMERINLEQPKTAKKAKK